MMCAPSCNDLPHCECMTMKRIYSRNIIYSVLLLQLKGFYRGCYIHKENVALMTDSKVISEELI